MCVCMYVVWAWFKKNVVHACMHVPACMATEVLNASYLVNLRPWFHACAFVIIVENQSLRIFILPRDPYYKPTIMAIPKSGVPSTRGGKSLCTTYASLPYFPPFLLDQLYFLVTQALSGIFVETLPLPCQKLVAVMQYGAKHLPRVLVMLFWPYPSRSHRIFHKGSEPKT